MKERLEAAEIEQAKASRAEAFGRSLLLVRSHLVDIYPKRDERLLV
jgi:hypothetical protein